MDVLYKIIIFLAKQLDRLCHNFVAACNALCNLGTLIFDITSDLWEYKRGIDRMISVDKNKPLQQICVEC